MMAYISSSSFVYQRVIGMPSWAYGLAFAVNALGMMLGGVVSPLGGLAGDDTAVPFAIVMVCSGACALVTFGSARLFARRHPETEQGFAAASA